MRDTNLFPPYSTDSSSSRGGNRIDRRPGHRSLQQAFPLAPVGFQGRAGRSIFVASDGASGLNLALQKNPDIIILDIKLPRLDGYEICRRLRQEGCKTPVIMLTVKDQEIDKVLGLELGADDYVTKPFSLRELSARVKAVLRRAEARGTGLAEYKFGHVIDL